jgi:arylsulfatase A-like enzyme
VQQALALNADFAPLFLDLAGLPIPADMQGRSLRPLLQAGPPPGWRTSFYYRYYHDPGDHNTRAHYGVRTETHKLIYFWKKNQWECYDLVHDPYELKNIYDDPAQAGTVAKLKAELYRLKKELRGRESWSLGWFERWVHGEWHCPGGEFTIFSPPVTPPAGCRFWFEHRVVIRQG